MAVNANTMRLRRTEAGEELKESHIDASKADADSEAESGGDDEEDGANKSDEAVWNLARHMANQAVQGAVNGALGGVTGSAPGAGQVMNMNGMMTPATALEARLKAAAKAQYDALWGPLPMMGPGMG